MCPIRNIEICQLVHLQQRVTCTPWNRRRVPTLVFCVGMGWERFPVIRTFPARDVSLVQSQYNKLTLDHDNDIPRLIKQWLKLLFNKLAIDGFCCLSSLIDYLKEHNTDFLTSSQRQIYVEEGIFRIENDMQWLTFEQLIYLLTHQVRNGRETSLPNPLPPPQQTQPRQFLTYKVPTTQELLPLFPRLAIDDSFKSRIEQNLQAANQISAQLSSRCDESICERIESMMQESSIKKRSDYDSDEEDMEIVGENLALKLLACRRKPLSLEEEAAVDSALKPPYDNTILCEKFKIPISRSKMSCLRPVTWLNDEVINFYLEMLAERDALLCQTPNTTRLPSHYFNTFFISKLLERGVFTYSNVRRWTRKINIFEKDKIFFPINISDTHWTLAVAYMQEKRVVYFDSMGGIGDSYTRAIVDYIVHEARDKKGLEISPSDWKREAAIRTIPVLPQQHNGSDCGMFTLMFADFISDNLDLSGFSQSDIKDYRRKVVAAILRGSLNYDVY